ncbi:MAG: LacI family DNA-binding transcriptional regulator [Lachnospiraceae bacterium]|jgi:LacI family transcriptional regulator|nr:LacI family DNA-binding transcriptional regulator [Lachnospiraceae bacterium]MDD3616259.1 LacI family DNA-binding transcriptional regulator [Lachnospiraceae bacterium]
MSKKKATSTEVAREAGVSQATVSMVLNKKYNVSFSKETIARVEAAAKKLNYNVPKQRTRKSNIHGKLIVVVCPTLTNPYYVTLLQGIEEVAKEKGFNVFVCNTQRNLEIEERLLKTIQGVQPLGIIYTCNPSKIYMEKISEISREIPMVIINNRETILEVNAVALNNRKPGILMARHLLELGHKKVAFISPPLTDRQQQRSKRVEGFVNEFKNAGLADGVLVRSADPDSEEAIPNVNSEYNIGYQLTKELLKEHLEVTAIAGLNDMIAFGVMDALAEEKYKVPGDISVIGCDNTLFSGMRQVSLTTIEHFVPLKGRDAGEIVLKLIAERKEWKLEERPRSIYHIEYEPKLIVRRSTGYARTKK